MNVKLKVLTVGALFFIGGQAVMAQKTKKDSIKERQIDEIVVVGYQKKAKDEITQAVSVVGGDELKRMASSSTSVTNLLQGKMSGLQVVANSGKPGETGSVRIRGAINVSTTQGASDPLFVVDGVYMTQRQFNAIPSTDIESITELKDAASSAQYGARGGNGVIVVTTKRGKKGKPSFSFETKFGFAEKPKDINFTMMNASQKIAYEQELYDLGAGGATYTSSEISDMLALNHDWSKDILRKSAIENYNFSVRGGSDTNRYFVSLGHDSDTGILKGLEGFVRHNARFNFDQNVTDKIKMGLDVGVANIRTDDQRYSYNALSPFYSLYSLNPYEPVYLDNGKFNPTYNNINPVDLANTEVTRDWRTRFNGQVFGSYELMKGLEFKTTFGGIYDLRKNKYIVRKGSNIAAVYGVPDGQLRDTRSDFFTFVFNNRLDYKKAFGNHKVGATAMFEYSQEDFGSLSGTKRVMLAPDITDISTAATPATITGTTSRTTYNSMVGILDYNYGNRYLISGSFNRTGNSRIGEGDKYGNFWALSAAWNLARESFVNLSYLDDFKIRYSTGLRGNVGGLEDYQNIISASAGDYGTDPTVGPVGTIGNTGIKWEKVQSQNLGVDLGIFKRLRLSVEVFKDDRKDFIYRIPNTQYEGGGYVYSSITNAGNIQIKGLEAELNYDVIKNNNFNWSLRGNFTSLDYKVKSLYLNQTDLSMDGYTFMSVGNEPTMFKLVKSAGVDPANGDALYYKPDGTITNVYSSGDAQYLKGKSTLPSVYGGFGTTFSYKGFDLNADFSFQKGGYSLNIMALNLVDPASFPSNVSTDATNFWRNPGDTNVLPRPVANGLELTDRFLQKTDFIRFRSLDFGYTFGKDFLGKDVFLDSLRVYVSGQNLAIWTDFVGDPEVATASETQVSGNFVPGSYNLYNYPNTRTFLFGVQVNF